MELDILVRFVSLNLGLGSSVSHIKICLTAIWAMLTNARKYYKNLDFCQSQQPRELQHQSKIKQLRQLPNSAKSNRKKNTAMG